MAKLAAEQALADSKMGSFLLLRVVPGMEPVGELVGAIGSAIRESDAAGLVDGDVLYLLMRQAQACDLPIIRERLSAKQIAVKPSMARTSWRCCSTSLTPVTVRGVPLDLACRCCRLAADSCAGLPDAVDAHEAGPAAGARTHAGCDSAGAAVAPLLVVLLSVRSAVFGEGLKESALESLRFNDDLHRSILVHDRDADAGVVPLEEALIVNDPAYRRRLMLSMLTEEPTRTWRSCRRLSLTTTLRWRTMPRRRWRRSPRSPTLNCSSWSAPLRRTRARKTSTNTVIFLVNTRSGLAEGRVAQIQRQQYARLLARRCEREDTLELRIRYATALADVGQIDEAQAVTDQLVLDVPEEQEVWMLCLRLAVMRRDGDEVHRVIDAIDNQHVYSSAANREQLAFWRDGEEAR